MLLPQIFKRVDTRLKLWTLCVIVDNNKHTNKA